MKSAPDSSSLVLPTEISEAIDWADKWRQDATGEKLIPVAEVWYMRDLLLRVETARQELERQVQELQKGSRVDSHRISENTSTASDNKATPATSTVRGRLTSADDWWLRDVWAEVGGGRELTGPLVRFADVMYRTGRSSFLFHGLPAAREAGSADAGPTVSDGETTELQRLRDHLHVAEQEVVKWKEQLDIRGRLWMEVAEANAKALHVAEQERDALQKKLAQQIAELNKDAMMLRECCTGKPTHSRSGVALILEKWRDSLANLLTEGRSQDGQP
jgi:hypothetical protein